MIKNEYIKTQVINLIFPPRCAVCDEVLPLFVRDIRGVNHICDKCKGLIRYLAEPCCMRCGKEIADEEAEFCDDCASYDRGYVKGFPLLNYVPPVSKAVLAMKYEKRQEYADFYGAEIALRFGNIFKELGIEAVIPVPLHKNKLKQRGYNQAEVLARVISEKTGIPIRCDILERVLDTAPQKELSDTEREKNVHLAFGLLKGAVCPENVILVDDIYTTGATIEGCTKWLKNAGAKNVYYTSICIGKV